MDARAALVLISMLVVMLLGSWWVSCTASDLAEPRLPTLELVRQIEQCDKEGGYPLFDVNGRREAAAVTCRVMVGDE